MNFYRKHWHEVGIWIFIALTFVMGFSGREIAPLRSIMIYSFMALLVHQFEEYVCPGGFPITFNYGFFGNKDDYDRHPLNAEVCLWVNVIFAYPFYILPIFFPNIIWLGLAQIFFGMIFQFLAHGFIMNIRNHTLYNPGMIAAVGLHFPIGVYYVWYLLEHNLATGKDFVLGFLGMIGGIVFTLVIPLLICKKFRPVIPFTPEEVAKFDAVARIDRAAK